MTLTDCITPQPTQVDPAHVSIRPARRDDCAAMLGLIQELAEYEKAPEKVTVTLNAMTDAGFGPNPIWGAYVAELTQEASDPVVFGMALYYYRYSTWKGRMLYLEDFVVSEKYRGGGVGKRLFDTVIEHGKREGCSGMVWQALDWNEPALNFYRKYNADIDPSWVNCGLAFMA